MFSRRSMAAKHLKRRCIDDYRLRLQRAASLENVVGSEQEKLHSSVKILFRLRGHNCRKVKITSVSAVVDASTKARLEMSQTRVSTGKAASRRSCAVMSARTKPLILCPHNTPDLASAAASFATDKPAAAGQKETSFRPFQKQRGPTKAARTNMVIRHPNRCASGRPCGCPPASGFRGFSWPIRPSAQSRHRGRSRDPRRTSHRW